MDFHLADRPATRRSGAIAATLAVHVAMVLIWQMTRPVPASDTPAERMVVWFVTPAKPAPKAARPTPRTGTPAPVAHQPRRPAAAAAPRPDENAMQIVPAAAAPTEPLAPAAPAAPSAEDILRQARRDIGSIDRDLRGQARKGMVQAPVSTPQKRLVAGIALAAELAPPGLFEAPKIKEIIDPGGYGRRRYRVITANGTYCLTYENAASSSNGMDMARAPNQRKTNCPPDELPPTTQP